MTKPNTAPRRGFTPEEFAHRLQRAQRHMAEHQLDGLLVTQPMHFRYFSGLDMQFWESPTRPWFLVLPADGAIRAVVPEIGAPAVAATGIKDVRSWPAPRPADDGVSLLAQTLAELPRKHRRIGAELGREQSLRMPVTEFHRLEDKLACSDIRLVDGSPCLWNIRMIKSEAEIGHIRHICQIACDSYDAVPEFVSIGDSEVEACRKFRIDLLRRGADNVPFLPGISGPGGIAQIICGPGERRIENGDILFFDTGAVYDGYFCDFDRNYAVGQVSDAAREAQDVVWRATEAGLAAARPGATTDELFSVMAKVLVDGGSLGNNVGRLGHGLGMQLTEPPSHMPGDGTVIREGMVLTIEPGMEYAPGKMIVHEENVVIRAEGAELLTRRSPRELPVIGRG